MRTGAQRRRPGRVCVGCAGAGYRLILHMYAPGRYVQHRYAQHTWTRWGTDSASRQSIQRVGCTMGRTWRDIASRRYEAKQRAVYRTDGPRYSAMDASGGIQMGAWALASGAGAWALAGWYGFEAQSVQVERMRLRVRRAGTRSAMQCRFPQASIGRRRGADTATDSVTAATAGAPHARDHGTCRSARA